MVDSDFNPFAAFSSDLASASPSIETASPAASPLLQPISTKNTSSSVLPQCGFPLDAASGSRNPISDPWPQHNFLFRVWRKDDGVVQLHSAVGFVAPLFKYASIRLTAEELDADIRSWRATRVLSSYDVQNRLLDSSVSTSPFIPTTLSFFWALSWACRTHKWADLSKIFISIIRGRDIHPVTICMPLQHCIARTIEYKFAHLAQEAFVYGRISESAVIATVDLATLQAPKLMPGWMDASPDPEDAEEYRKFRDWAHDWAEAFRQQDVSAHAHSLDMFRLADQLVRHGRSESPPLEDVLALGQHLFGWPYRPRDGHSYHSTSLAPDFISSLAASFQTLLASIAASRTN